MVQYFGRVIADRDLPWHYPWFYFAVTVPIGLQALGALGIVRGWINRRLDPFPLLLAATIVLFLGLFSTRVPVYDGERLFLECVSGMGAVDRIRFWMALGPRVVDSSPSHRTRGLLARSELSAWSRCTHLDSAITMGWSVDCRGRNGSGSS